MLQLFRVKLFNDLLLPLDDIRILLVEGLEAPLVLEEHFQQPSSPLQHFVQSILKPSLETALCRRLRRRLTPWLGALAALVLGVPDVVRYEFLNLRLLFVAQLFLSDLVRTEHLHQPRHVLDQNVVARDHYLLMTVHVCLSLVLRCLRCARHPVRTVSGLLAALRGVARRRYP